MKVTSPTNRPIQDIDRSQSIPDPSNQSSLAQKLSACINTDAVLAESVAVVAVVGTHFAIKAATAGIAAPAAAVSPIAAALTGTMVGSVFGGVGGVVAGGAAVWGMMRYYESERSGSGSGIILGVAAAGSGMVGTVVGGIAGLAQSL